LTWEDLARADRERCTLEVQQDMCAKADPTMARIVLQNLLENAVKYSSKSATPKVEVGTTVFDGEAAFFVRDNGIGFEMQYMEKIFQPFERLHRDTEYPGTGIGLANVRRIVMRHGGRVWADAAPGIGSTFYFTLPGDIEDPETTPALTSPSYLR
jgi:light-regulated signal transduction histidine kinase (bacteriophytochrome)